MLYSSQIEAEADDTWPVTEAGLFISSFHGQIVLVMDCGDGEHCVSDS